MIKILWTISAVLFGAQCLVADDATTPANQGPQLGESGYVLHHGEGEKPGEYAISLYSKLPELPSVSFLVAEDRKSVRILVVKDFGDRIVFYTDTDGDGLADEGMERDKAKQTLRKFKLKFIEEAQ